MNFVLVNIFDPVIAGTEIKQKSFFINLDLIVRIDRYDPEVHTMVHFYGIGDKRASVPEGALDSIFVHYLNATYHLDVESSQRVLRVLEG